MADSPTEIACAETNEDILATVRCLQALGADIAVHPGMIAVSPLPRPLRAGQRTLDCGESGSTLRFMLPVACALGANACFLMRARLPKRPLSPLYEQLAAHGCALSAQGVSPLTVSGSLRGGRYTVAGNVSSQYVTGLLLALPLLSDDSELQITGELESRPYVELTLQTLRGFGVAIPRRDDGFFIRGGQPFRSPGTLSIEGDWSNAACWLAAGALGTQAVTVTGLAAQSPQGDKAFLDILARFGAKVRRTETSVTVSGGTLTGVTADARDIPDLVPMIAAVALAARGETHIHHAERLRLKESDRLRVIAETLRSFGAEIAQTPDGLRITGGRPLHGAQIDAAEDHRIVMMAAVASALCEGKVTIRGADAVHKSYPRFFADFRTLGGVAREDV